MNTLLIAVVKDGHTFLFIYPEDQAAEALKLPGLMVADSDGLFEWSDADKACTAMRKLAI